MPAKVRLDRPDDRRRRRGKSGLGDIRAGERGELRERLRTDADILGAETGGGGGGDEACAAAGARDADERLAEIVGEAFDVTLTPPVRRGRPWILDALARQG